MKNLLKFRAEFSKNKRRLAIHSDEQSYTMEVRGLDEGKAAWEVRNLLHRVTDFKGEVELEFPNGVKARTF